MALAATLALPACDGVKIANRVRLQGVDIGSTVEAGNPIWSGGAVTVTNRAIVGGVRYAGSAAAITMDGHSASYNQLRSGQILSLRGKRNADGQTGTAHDTVQQTTVIGPVRASDPVHRSLLVLGHLIRMGASTHFGDGIDLSGFTGLDIGTTEVVNGLLASHGEVHATRIARDTSHAMFQVVARVTIDTHNRLFRVQGLTVNCRDAAIIDLPDPALTAGTLVLVRGRLNQEVFLAQEIRTPISAYRSP